MNKIKLLIAGLISAIVFACSPAYATTQERDWSKCMTPGQFIDLGVLIAEEIYQMSPLHIGIKAKLTGYLHIYEMILDDDGVNVTAVCLVQTNKPV